MDSWTNSVLDAVNVLSAQKGRGVWACEVAEHLGSRDLQSRAAHTLHALERGGHLALTVFHYLIDSKEIQHTFKSGRSPCAKRICLADSRMDPLEAHRKCDGRLGAMAREIITQAAAQGRKWVTHEELAAELGVSSEVTGDAVGGLAGIGATIAFALAPAQNEKMDGQTGP